MKCFKNIILILLILIITDSIAFSQYKIKRHSFANNTAKMSDGNNNLYGNLGHSIAGVSASNNRFYHGFWFNAINVPIIIQNIALSTGWNMISTYIEPTNPAMEAVWANIVDKVLIVKNNQGAAYIPSFDINNIGNWSKTDGYLVYMTSAETLEIKGKKIKPSATPINLNVGWAIVPYLRNTNMSPDLSFQTLTDEEALLIAKDRLGNAYIPSFEIDNLINLVPGQAYKIYVSKNGSQLIYPD